MEVNACIVDWEVFTGKILIFVGIHFRRMSLMAVLVVEYLIFIIGSGQQKKFTAKFFRSTVCFIVNVCIVKGCKGHELFHVCTFL